MNSSPTEDQGNDPYGAIKFGEFRKYMQNKQSKLKKQQKELGGQASQELDPIFKGTSIYINGYTDPPTSDLRTMILQHGGDYQHYLKKNSVTHIIATNLTNSKLQEFRFYKVVKPNWVTESVEKNQIQPWQNYRLVPIANKQKELLFSSSSTTTPQPPTGKELNADLLSNTWARSISTVNPEFIKRYYETSRLHYLSTWKSELKQIVENLQEKYPFSSSKKSVAPTKRRVVMHIDFDCFFASVGIKDRSWLRDLPVAVSHSKVASETSSSDIASCNYVARSFGIRNGMTIGSAKLLCPELQVIPYEFEKYRSISKIFYEIVFQYADEMQAVSVDEALLEVGSHFTTTSQGQEEALATKIRDEIRQNTGCEASIGIGFNILLARLSTKRAKPAGQYFCKTQQDVDDLLGTSSIMDLPGVGYAITEKLEAMNIKSIGDMKCIPLYQLQQKLGSKLGQNLYNFSRGLDDRRLLVNQPRQSVSAEVNWGVRFESDKNEREFVTGLSKEVADRLVKYGVKGKTFTIKILKRQEDATEAQKQLGHGNVNSFSKSCTLNEYTADSDVIDKHVYDLLKSFPFSFADIRGLGITVTKLNNVPTSPDQGKLKFNKTLSMNDASSSNRPQREKEEMIVDYNVYHELPVSVQQELMSNYTLVFQTKDKGKGRATEQPAEVVIPLASIDTQENNLSIPELPPWSQLDPAALLALPENMRAQVLQAYEINNKSPPQQKTPSSGSDRNRTITQLFHQQQQQPKKRKEVVLDEDEEEEGLVYDANVLNELPLDMRTEILAEHKRYKQQPTTTTTNISTTNQQTIQEINTYLFSQIPSFHGLTSLSDLRSLLKEWVTTDLNQQDIESFSDFLVQLIQTCDLEKAHLLIVYLRYLGMEQLQEIQEKVNECMMSIYGYPLKF